jgi:hypothetical protein
VQRKCFRCRSTDEAVGNLQPRFGRVAILRLVRKTFCGELDGK